MNDWYGWVTNQSGHFLLGLVIAFFTKRIWPVIAVSLVFEVAQGFPDVWDSLADVLFALAGGVFYLCYAQPIMIAVVVALAIGVIQRLGNGKD